MRACQPGGGCGLRVRAGRLLKGAGSPTAAAEDANHLRGARRQIYGSALRVQPTASCTKS